MALLNPYIYPRPAHAYDIDRSVTRTEILWRTFRGDMVVDGQFPAPSDVEEEFFRWLCFWILARTYVYEEKLYRNQPNLRPPEGQKRWERIFSLVRKLLEQEPETSIFNLDIVANLTKRCYPWMTSRALTGSRALTVDGLPGSKITRAAIDSISRTATEDTA